MKECIMNKKFIFTLLLLINQHTHINTQPAMGVEMTFPLGALLYLLPGGALNAIKSNISSHGGWTHSPYWKDHITDQFTVRCPQVDGYFSTTDSFDLVLQAGTNQEYGFRNPNGTYGSPIFYFSDMVRTQRRYPKQWWGIKDVPYSKGPSDSITRGQPNNSWGTSVDESLHQCLFTRMTGARLMKYYGFFSAKSLTITPNSFSGIGGEDSQFYFAGTGVGIYLPLHMISPGENLLAAEPDYLNFGPAPGTPAYNTPIPGNILPWTHGYMPKNIPAIETKKPQSDHTIDF